ncbi:MAG: hypothetical protein ABI729_08595, partial [Chitinophagales bacterium]
MVKRISIAMILVLPFISCHKCDEFSPSDCKDCLKKLAGEWHLNYLATNGVDSVKYFDSLYKTT